MNNVIGENVNVMGFRINNRRDRNNKFFGFVMGRYEGVLLKVVMIYFF